MAILEKYHYKAITRVVPMPPKPFPYYLVLGNAKTSDLEENLTGLVLFGSFGLCVAGMALGSTGIIGDGLTYTMMGGSVISSIFAIRNFIILDDERNSIGYFVQRAWRKLGLPAKKFKFHDYEVSLQHVIYQQALEKWENDAIEFEKEVRPALDYLNANSNDRYFSFDSKGLKVSNKQISSLKALKEETRAIVAKENTAENLSLERGI